MFPKSSGGCSCSDDDEVESCAPSEAASGGVILASQSSPPDPEVAKRWVLQILKSSQVCRSRSVVSLLDVVRRILVDAPCCETKANETPPTKSAKVHSD